VLMNNNTGIPHLSVISRRLSRRLKVSGWTPRVAARGEAQLRSTDEVGAGGVFTACARPNNDMHPTSHQQVSYQLRQQGAGDAGRSASS
jgi:hypothetical protein